MKNYTIIDEDLLDFDDNTESKNKGSRKFLKTIKLILCAMLGEGFLRASYKAPKDNSTDYLDRYY